MAQTLPEHSAPFNRYAADRVDEYEGLQEVFAPLLAGARARGIADAFELMGQAAILIDRQGAVLHAGGRASRALLPFARIEGGHLVGRDEQTNQALQTVIAAAVGGAREVDKPVEVCLGDTVDEARVILKSLPYRSNDQSLVQLLHAVLIVNQEPAPRP